MKILKEPSQIRKTLTGFKENNYKIGFVPTMGALHTGHISLVRQARRDSNICVVSIFVNPTQFNDKNDLKKYPRTPDEDLDKLNNEDVDFVFMPEVKSIYPDNNLYSFDLKGKDKHMEGKHRPGHFDGVADIVYRLFNIIKPDYAYFGQKDFQQLSIIKTMAETENIDTKITGVPTVREESGLAMSSRNKHLSNEGKNEASNIYKTLKSAKKRTETNSPQELKRDITEEINSYELLDCEYVEIVEEASLIPVDKWNSSVFFRLCAAVWCENVRLIDNVRLESK